MTRLHLMAGLIGTAVIGGCSLTLDFDSRPADGIDVDGGEEIGIDSGRLRSDGSTNGNDGAPLANDGSADGALPGNDCPGTAGPKPVRVGAYCIDSTEVTNAEYAKFRDAPNKPVLHGDCEGMTLEPANFPGPNDFPVVRVNWCGAFAYCQWAGKRLCGKIEGGAADSATVQNQWYLACSANGTKAYPYGATYDADACWYGGKPTTQKVGMATACVGGTAGIFDMSGNVGEWEDSCGSGAAADCSVRGAGADDSKPSDAACAYDGKKESRDKLNDDFIGFRCCSP